MFGIFNNPTKHSNPKVVGLTREDCKKILHLNFSNVKVIFLPANTTSTLQPMDAGIIKCLKGYYRVKICRKIISMVENKEEVTPSSIKFFDALEMLTSAWNYDLKPEVISNCFRHCGFFNAKCRDEPVEHEDVISREMAEMRNTFSSFYKESTLDDFIELDSTLLTNEPLELLVDNVSEIQEILEDDKDDKDDEMVQLKKVKRSEALNAVEILKLFAVQGDGSDELLNLLNRVEDKVYQRKLSLVQKQLSF
ncbi:unnamed protein product [Brachionus calyciflorus]|uniref:DDE-1 domain-containing protein n=1 Tax=Brachionus calyciflorus TaxID=104777 RepID=A0A814EU95_9BILA|nr:unnamed protein product [Brachionus calyciflorus]